MTERAVKNDSKLQEARKSVKGLSKGLRTQERILHSAIHCLSHLGYEKTTFQSIADHCGISQPLVVHYFKKKENVFPAVIEYLTSRTQKIIDAELDHNQAPADRLREFVRLSISNARKDIEAAKVFLTLSFLAAFDERYRQSNALIKQVAVNELIEILVAGVRTGDFEVPEITLTAKLLASYIMGVRMNLLNEKVVSPVGLATTASDEALIRLTEEHCLSIVKYRG